MRDHKSDVNDALNNGSHIIKMSEIRHKGLENIWEHLPYNEDCYVTIGIDSYDMSLYQAVYPQNQMVLILKNYKNPLKA